MSNSAWHMLLLIQVIIQSVPYVPIYRVIKLTYNDILQIPKTD